MSQSIQTAGMRVGNMTIGAGKPVFVIAEIGVNHDGSAGRALDLVRYAARGGANAVKLQLFRADELMHASTALAGYQRDRTDARSATEMLRRYELSDADVERVVRAIRAAGMLPLATPFSVGDVHRIEKLDLPAIKIASPDVVNRPLLEASAATGRPLIASTGAATLDEIDASVGWLRELNASFALMHCTSSYPTVASDANLCLIGELAERYGVPIGFSDHTTDLSTGALSAAAGAVVIEKHLTYDRNASGPDHAASANPVDFARYVASVRQAEALLGTPGKRVLDCERDVRRVSRQSLVVTRRIDSGEPIRREDLAVQRPGLGVPAAECENVVGRRMKRAIAPGTMLQWDMLADAA